MRVEYVQKNGSTFVSVGDGKKLMSGVSRLRPGDRFNKNLGLAVALLKAQQGGITDSQELEQVKAMALVGRKRRKLERLELDDDIVIIWLRYWHEYRLALKAIAEKKDAAAGRIDELSGLDWVKQMRRSMKLPSNGQLGESFALRMVKEMQEKLHITLI